jgi:hypothetical protein
MKQVTFFTKPDCTLCRAALHVVRRVQGEVGFYLEIVDISAPQHASWHRLYKNDIPVVHIDGTEAFRHRVDQRAFRARIQA